MPALYPVYPGMVARLADGGTTTVVAVLPDPSGQTAPSLVLNAHGFFGQDVVAPYAAVWHVDDEVHLSLSTAEVRALPTFDASGHSHGTHHGVAPPE